jgi:hypothetical protein
MLLSSASRRLVRVALVLALNLATYSLATVPVRAMSCEGNQGACQDEGFIGCCDGSCDCYSQEGYEICICPCC